MLIIYIFSYLSLLCCRYLGGLRLLQATCTRFYDYCSQRGFVHSLIEKKKIHVCILESQLLSVAKYSSIKRQDSDCLIIICDGGCTVFYTGHMYC